MFFKIHKNQNVIKKTYEYAVKKRIDDHYSIGTKKKNTILALKTMHHS